MRFLSIIFLTAMLAAETFGQVSGTSKQGRIVIKEDKEGPNIELLQPAINEQDTFKTSDNRIILKGFVNDEGKITSLSINGAALILKENLFTELVTLEPGINRYIVSAVDEYNNESRFEFFVENYIINRGPTITLLQPEAQRGVKVVSKKEVVQLLGVAKDDDGVLRVDVNGRRTALSANGEFSLDIFLEVGENKIIIDAMDTKYKSEVDTFIVVRRLIDILTAGKYYAFIIGINDYEGFWPPLHNAVNDAEGLTDVLMNQYYFDEVISLINKDATRAGIIKKFEWLVDNITPNDNLLIFYAGHGEFRKKLNRGFWVPADATSNSTANYISNNDIKTFMSGIKSKHTLLITDACFAGDIFRGKKTESIKFDPNNMEKYYREVYSKPSRLALTSGSIEPVSDFGKDGHSIFTYYLLKALKENRRTYIDVNQLFNEFNVAVVNNSDQTPLLQVVRDTNDEGGQFIFVRAVDK